MRASNGEMLKWFRCSLFQRPLLARASKAAFVVGTILTVLNHGERLFQSEPFPVTLAWKIPLTYLVPFCLALYGALSNAKD
jgi:hypothetical protein